MKNLKKIVTASFIILLLSSDVATPLSIFMQNAPSVGRSIAAGAAAGAGIYASIRNKSRDRSRSGNFIPPVRDNKITFTDDFSTTTTTTRTRRNK